MTTYYISTRGSNSNPGTSIGSAWRTIQYGVDRLSAGDTLKVEGGTYTEDVFIQNIIGTASNPITIEALDLTAKPRIKSASSTPKVTFTDCSYLTWRGFELRDFTGKGYLVLASSKNVEGVTVDQCDFINCPPSDAPGHMVKVETKTASRTASQVHVTGNYFYKCWPTRPKNADGRLVGNETCTFVGNVKQSSMRDNILVECANIGLNLIGFDKTDGTVWKGQPSGIVISGNLFIDMQNTTGGACIYHDRALGPSLIENNTIVISNNASLVGTVESGIFIAGEAGGYSGNNLNKAGWESHIIIRNNVIDNRYLGVRLGLVEFPDFPAHDIVFVHNVVIGNSTSTYRHSPLSLESALGLIVKNNVIDHNNPNNPVVLRSDAPDLYTDPAGMANTWVVDGNLWHSSVGDAGMKFEWPAKSDMTGRAAWKTATGQGANGQYGTPVYTDKANRDYHLTAASPGNGDAIPLTYANGAGSSSTTLVVDDARYFSDGLFIVGGDQIMVGGTLAHITAVDWATNTLELESAISWADGDSIHYIYSGTAPSIGLTDTVGTGDPVTPPTDPGDSGGGGTPPPPPTGGVDILGNYNFDTAAWGGSLAWNKYTAGTASFAIASGQCTVNVTSTGGNTQLYQPGFEIVNGEDYDVEIVAQSASASHTIQVKVHQDDSPYANLGLDSSIAVTSTKTTFTLSFTATASETNSRLRLTFPITSEDVVFDSIRLIRKTYDTSGGGSGSTGTQTKAVAAGADDGFWTDGGSGFNATANQLRVGDNSGTMQSTFLRFAVDAIPDGSTITAAYLDLYCERVDGSSGWVHQIAFENSTSAAQPTGNTDLNGRTYLSATTWTLPAMATGTRYNSADLSSQVQSLLDSNSGFSSGDHLLVKLGDSAASGRLIGYESYEGAGAVGDMARVANLVIEWTEPGGAVDPAKRFSRTFAQSFNEPFSF